MVTLLRSVGRLLLAQPRFVAWIPVALWAAMIFAVSSITPDIEGLPIPTFGGFLQNLAHPGVFGILALLAVPVLGRDRGARWTALTPTSALWIVTVVTLYGFTDELHQSTVEGRDASLFDLLSDMVGAIATVVVVLYLGREDANERGLRKRLGFGLLACMAAAGLATAWTHARGEGPWPF